MACVGGASLAHAQQFAAARYLDKPIGTVTITVEGRPTTDRMLEDAVQTRGGAPLKMTDVRDSITHLYSLARFDDVKVEAAPDGPNVDLWYELTPVHPVSRVEFRGELGLSESTLRSRMVDRFGATPPVSRASDVAAVLEQLYREHGYLKAVVTPGPPVLEHVHESATLVFNVAAGPRARIAQSNVTGSAVESPAQVAARLQIEPGQPYAPAGLQRRVDDLITSLKHRGYYEAAARVQAVPNADATGVDVSVDIRLGPMIVVRFEGDPIPKEKIAELVPIQREGSVDPDLLEDAAHRISEYLKQQGYWKAEVNPPERRESGGQLLLVFTVKRGRQYHVAPDGVDITGNRSVSIDELRQQLHLGAGDLFISQRLDASVADIRQLYRKRGFASVDVQSQPNETADGLVKPAIVIKEGPRVLIGKITITGNHAFKTEDLMARTIRVKPGDPYYAPNIVQDRDRLQLEYLNAGYPSVDVTIPPPAPVVSGDTARADVAFHVVEGPQAIVEHIFITGNVRTDPSIIERELLLRPGRPLGLQDQIDSRRRLNALGLFRRVQISAVSHSDTGHRDVIVTVEEALQTTIGYGGGLEVDRQLRTGSTGVATEKYEFAPRGFFEIGRRNVGGRNRSVNLYTRVSLRPNNDPKDPKMFGFSEYRVVGTYREPRAFGGYGDLTGTAAVEQGVRSSFNFARKGLNAELMHRFSDLMRGSIRYSFGTTRIFDEAIAPKDILSVDRVFPQVRLSTFSLALSRDTRDDLLEPQSGTFVSGDATVAGRSFGSEVGFTKTFLQGFVYRNLGKPHLVFAGGARLGLANAFLRAVQAPDENGVLTTQFVRDLPASERFFAGGDTTIRGFALDSVGAPNTISDLGFPIGGDAEVVLNAELRAPVWGPMGAVVFMDGGNVFKRTGEMDLGAMRGSVGVGGRYRSPLGPIRLDIGFKLDRRTIAGKLEPRYAIHLSIGQAF
jgi:outer membrane protein insertion porin family